MIILLTSAQTKQFQHYISINLYSDNLQCKNQHYYDILQVYLQSMQITVEIVIYRLPNTSIPHVIVIIVFKQLIQNLLSISSNSQHNLIPMHSSKYSRTSLQNIINKNTPKSNFYGSETFKKQARSKVVSCQAIELCSSSNSSIRNTLTPKPVAPNSQRSLSITSPRPQNSTITLANLINLNLSTALSLLIRILKQCSSMHKMFGYVDFALHRCHLTYDGKIVMQMVPEGSARQSAMQDQVAVVDSVVGQVRGICAKGDFEDFFHYYKRVKTICNCDYKYMVSLIHSYCLCSKIKLQQKQFGLEINNQRMIKSQKYLSVNQTVKPSKRNSSSLNQIPQIQSILQMDTNRRTKNKFFLKNSNNNALTSSKSFRTLDTPLHLYSKHDDKYGLNKIKASLASTNFKTSAHQQSIKQSSMTFGSKCDSLQNVIGHNQLQSQLQKADNKQKGKKQKLIQAVCLNFLKNSNLQQVQSQHQQSQIQQNISQTTPYFAPKQHSICSQDLPSLEEKTTETALINNKISETMEHNHWKVSVDLYSIGTKALTESFQEGKDQYIAGKYDSEALGHLARVMTQSRLDFNNGGGANWQ